MAKDVIQAPRPKPWGILWTCWNCGNLIEAYEKEIT